jgi:hypothetical protein
MTNHSNIKLEEEVLNEILTFEKNLGRIFFTDTKVVICPSNDPIIKLAIEIDSNFSLPEIVSLVKMTLKQDKQSSNVSLLILKFKNCIYNLTKSIETSIDIEEVAFYFKNTSIIINSIEYKSIVEEMEGILNALLYHFEFYSTLMGSVPNEIHIPVFEDANTKKLLNLTELVKLPSFTSPYSKFWGLYFDSLEKPLIYNLNRTNIIPGDLDVSLE